MKLKELLDQYGEWEWVSTQVPENGEADVAMIQIKKPKQKSVWDLQDGDDCYYIDLFGDVNWSNYAEIESEEEKVSVGNVFLTKEEAEKDVERRKVETLLIKHGGRRWFKEGKENWFITFDHSVCLCFFKYTIRDPRQGMIYFDTEEELTEAVEQIGAERIIKALFEVR